MGKGLTYIILAAGVGKKLYPLTLDYSKMSFKLNSTDTILQRTVKKIRQYDDESEIVVVVGHQLEKIKSELENFNVTFVFNPFYDVTSSIASLWFARNYLDRQNVVVINGDVVFEDKLIKDIITKETDHPYVLIDTNRKDYFSYKVYADSDKVKAISRELANTTGCYCGITKLDAVSSRLLKYELDKMIEKGMHNLFFEDLLVQMIMFTNFDLTYKDASKYHWEEINSIDDFLKAQQLTNEDNK